MNHINVDHLRDIAELRFDHALHRKNLRESAESKLVISHNSGLFKATPQLIGFLQGWTTDSVIIADEYGNPVECNRNELLSELSKTYTSVMEEWFKKFNESKAIRKGSHV